LVRNRLGWRIQIPGEHARDVNQFGIAGLLMLTTGAACLLFLATRIGTDWNDALRSLSVVPLFRFCGFLAVHSLAVLSIGVSATGTILTNGPRRRFALWLVVSPVLFVLGFCALIWIQTSNVPGYWVPLAMPPLMVAGFLTSLCATLLVLRRCGYRLTSPDWQEMPMETKIPFAGGPPAGEEK
jgi:hypothetical protein